MKKKLKTLDQVKALGWCKTSDYLTNSKLGEDDPTIVNGMFEYFGTTIEVKKVVRKSEWYRCEQWDWHPSWFENKQDTLRFIKQHLNK